jgi:hypothetical protein
LPPISEKSRISGKIFRIASPNDKWQMLNDKFSIQIQLLVAACRAAALRFCVEMSFISVKSVQSVVLPHPLS